MILLAILLWGLLCGWLANILLGKGSHPAEWWPLLVAGLAGSFVGGMLLSLIVDGDINIHPSGLIGTVIGAVIVLGVIGVVRKDAA